MDPQPGCQVVAIVRMDPQRFFHHTMRKFPRHMELTSKYLAQFFQKWVMFNPYFITGSLFIFIRITTLFIVIQYQYTANCMCLPHSIISGETILSSTCHPLSYSMFFKARWLCPSPFGRQDQNSMGFSSWHGFFCRSSRS